jgi:hypothetical protein
MQSALTGYTVSFNLRHRLSGHVTQGRYGARLVGGDDYLYKLSRYVHLNPVQVKNWRVRPLGERLLRLREYPWSSFRAYAGIEPRESWVTYGPMMGLVGKEAGREEASYQVFVEEGLTKPDEDFLQEMEKSPRSIGDEQYREWVDERHAELGESHLVEDVSFRPERPRVEAGEVATRVAGLWGLKAEDLKLSCRGWEGKGILALMLEKYAGLTRRACSPWIGTTTGMSVNYQVSKALRSLDADPKLRKRLSKLEATLEREKGKC